VSNDPPIVPYAAPPYPASGTPPPPPNQLEVQQQLAAAHLAAKKVRRAAGVATADAWMIAIFAALSFVCGLFSGVSGVVMGMAMGAIAFFEFDGAARIRRLDLAAPKRLGYNQLAFAGLIIAYSLWSLYAELAGSGLSQELEPYKAQLGDVEGLMRLIAFTVYGTLIAVAILAQGGTALYYFSREKYIRQYLNTTPPWITEMQRHGGAPL
jgi:hypothetical protein